MPHSHYIKIINNTFGKVAIATRPIDKNMLVRVMNGYNITYPTQTSIRLGVEQHHEDRVGKFINHSCSPTLRVDNKGFPALWAEKNILPNMPLTINYFENEDVISSPFVCNDCGEWVPRVGGCNYYK